MSSLMRWQPFINSLGRWPSIWDDDDFPVVASANGNNLDIYETDNEVVVKANVAGVPAEKVNVTYEKGILWIRAQAEEETEDKKKKHYSKSSWNYSYKVAVPGEIDLNVEPNADVKSGVVTVSFKKAEASKPKTIRVANKE